MIQNAVSDTHSKYMDLHLDPKNQGGIQVQDGHSKCNQTYCLPQTTAVVLDDLLEVVNFEKAMMKIDIEGHEHRAFQHGHQLFRKVYISHIFMEWMKLKEYYHNPIEKPMVLDLLNFLQEEGYTPFSAETGTTVTPRYWYSWPNDVIWKHDLVGFV